MQRLVVVSVAVSALGITACGGDDRGGGTGKRTGHAGAIISGGKGAASDKIAALKAAGIAVAPTPAEMRTTLAKLLS